MKLSFNWSQSVVTLNSDLWTSNLSCKGTIWIAKSSWRSRATVKSITKLTPQKVPYVGLEPTTFGLEVQRAIHCANRACDWQPLHQNLKILSSAIFQRYCLIPLATRSMKNLNKNYYSENTFYNISTNLESKSIIFEK